MKRLRRRLDQNLFTNNQLMIEIYEVEILLPVTGGINAKGKTLNKPNLTALLQSFPLVHPGGFLPTAHRC